MPNPYLLIRHRLTKLSFRTLGVKTVNFRLKCDCAVADNKRSYKKIFSPLRKTSGAVLLLDVFFFYTSLINHDLSLSNVQITKNTTTGPIKTRKAL